MNKDFEGIRNISPLDMTNYLLKLEICNKETAEELFNKIDNEFETKDGIIDTMIKPALFGMFDGIGRKYKLKVPVSQLVQECTGFNSSSYGSFTNEHDITFESQREFDRKKNDNVYKRNKYRDELSDGKTVKDEYTGERIYKKHKEAEKRNFKNKTTKTGDVDHIIPLKKIYKQVENNPMLTQSDIKEISNSTENYAFINSKLNRSKGDSLNSVVIKENSTLPEGTKQTMLAKHKKAQNNIDKDINKAVVKNLKNKDLRSSASNEIKSKSLNTGKDAAKEGVILRASLLFIKTTYFEISDSLKNGVCHNMGVSCSIEALKKRFKRSINYIMSSLKDVMSGGFKDFLVETIKCGVKLVFDLFAGVVKSIGKIITTGFHAIVQSLKLLISPPPGMSLRERLDAITKLITTTAVGTLLTVSKETILAALPNNPLKDILFILLEGFAVAFVAYLLNKIDIFDVKREMKLKRIEEVFNERISEIKESTDDFKKTSIEVLYEQKKDFVESLNKMKIGIVEKDFDIANEMAFNIAERFNIDLGYSNEDEFIEMVDNEDMLVF